MSEQNKKDLPERMINLANKDGLEKNHEMRETAHLLQKACDAYFLSEPKITTFKFVGYWARARKVWCEYTGEPLVG